MYAVLSVTVPVFLIALIGFFYARASRLEIGSAGQLNLDIFIPALLLYALSEKLPAIGSVAPMVLAGALVVLGSGLLVWPLARWLKLEVRMFLPPLMFNNAGNLGLPLALLAFGEQGMPWAVALFVTGTLLHFTVGMTMLQGRLDIALLLRNPIVLATLAGLVMYLQGWHFPPVVLEAVRLMADVSIPLMLVSLGFYLAQASHQDLRIGLLGAVLTPLSGLLMAAIALPLFDLSAQQTANLLLFAALPPAVMNSMLAEKFKVSPASVASIVALGNIFSIGVLPLVLYWLLP